MSKTKIGGMDNPYTAIELERGGGLHSIVYIFELDVIADVFYFSSGIYHLTSDARAELSILVGYDYVFIPDDDE